MISKSKKQKQHAKERERIKNLNTRIGQRTEIVSRIRKPDPEEVAALFQERQNQSPATDYELAYASNDYASDKRSEDTLTESEHQEVSHFKRNIGMASSLGTESSEEKEAYDKDTVNLPKLSLDNASIKQYIIASEILGKPKALRK